MRQIAKSDQGAEEEELHDEEHDTQLGNDQNERSDHDGAKRGHEPQATEGDSQAHRYGDADSRCERAPCLRPGCARYYGLSHCLDGSFESPG